MNEVWKSYIDALSSELLAQSRTANHLKHNVLKGSARESFVRSFLSKFLPESLGVGTGEIFDRRGKRSRQIDVIVYDKTFPIPSIGDGLRLFPIDSVVATIEVKSNLDQTALDEALVNCVSVTRMGYAGKRQSGPFSMQSSQSLPSNPSPRLVGTSCIRGLTSLRFLATRRTTLRLPSQQLNGFQEAPPT